MKRRLVTCGLPYSNGFLHVGHIAGCYLPGDIYVRYLRQKGDDVMFICGSDDHGVPIKLSAEKEGKEPREIAKFYNAAQERDLASLGIHFNKYGSTSGSEIHKEKSQDFFKTLHEKGYFEKKSSKQFYDESSKMFLPDRYVQGTCGYCGAEHQNSDQCEECGKQLDLEHLKDAYSVISKQPASIKETYHWYINLKNFEGTVLKWLESAEIREHTRNFVKGLLGAGLVERAITRDLDWGIPLPIDALDSEGKVLYVWFDAPIGYISNTVEACGEDYSKWWQSEDCEILHFIGEDNTVFHCIIWIAMLTAEGSYQLPKGVIVNNFVNIKTAQADSEKISKSRGNAVWINEYMSAGGNPDSLRYYLTSIAPEKARSVFVEEDLIQKHNSELANALGNFVNRVLSFYQKHFGQELIPIKQELLDQDDQDFEAQRQAVVESTAKLIEEFSFKAAQTNAFDFVRACNAYIDVKAPWSQRKEDPQLAQNTLLNCINAIYTLSIILEPFLPLTAKKMQSMLESTENNWNAATANITSEKLGEICLLFSKIDNT